MTAGGLTDAVSSKADIRDHLAGKKIIHVLSSTWTEHRVDMEQQDTLTMTESRTRGLGRRSGATVEVPGSDTFLRSFPKIILCLIQCMEEGGDRFIADRIDVTL